MDRRPGETLDQYRLRHARQRERATKATGAAFVAFWLLLFALSLGILGVFVWAVIRVVLHFT